MKYAILVNIVIIKIGSDTLHANWVSTLWVLEPKPKSCFLLFLGHDLIVYQASQTSPSISRTLLQKILKAMRFPSVIQIAHHYLPVKCTPQNYLYWHTQIVPFLFSQTLLGFVDGSYTSPPTHVQLCPTFTPPNNPDYLL